VDGVGNDNGYSVGEVAALARVSVRALHHYDEIGLLRPGGHTAAGHRRYGTADLARLREIMFYRELDFGLDEIASMLADPDEGTDTHLRNQHRMLRERIERQRLLLRALEKEMEARDMGISLTPEEQFEIFGKGFSKDYADEAERRWGDTDAWKQSQARTAAMTKQEWVEVKADQDAMEAAFAEAMRAGEPVDGIRARELAELHRASVSRFWDCNHAAHRSLAQMYVEDERFGQHYEDIVPGLAQYVHDAIVANADAHQE